jgi:hypothetical protein
METKSMVQKEKDKMATHKQEVFRKGKKRKKNLKLAK